MQKFFSKYYIQVIVIGIFFVFIAVMIQQSFQIYGKIKQKSVELKQAKMDQLLAEEYLSNMHEFKKNAKYIEENNHYLDLFLSNDDDRKIELFSLIEQVARDTGNDNVTLTVKSKAKENTDNKDKNKKKTEEKIKPLTKDYLALDILLVGNYDDLIAFLKKMENMPYMSDVMSVRTVKNMTEETSRKNVDSEEEDDVLRKNLVKSEVTVVFYMEEKK